MEDADPYVRITLRIPKEIHARLTEGAAARSHSMNAEIVQRLSESFDPERLGLGALLAKQTEVRETLDALMARIEKMEVRAAGSRRPDEG